MSTTACVPLRLLAAVLPFTAKKDIRYYLNGMLLEPLQAGNAVGVRAVATDGYVLGIATDTSACWDKAAERVIVPIGLIESIFKAATRKTDDVTLKFSREGDGIQIEATVENQKIIGRAIDGTFPDYQAVVPFAPLNNEPISFNPELVERFITSAKACKRFGGCGKYCAMRMVTQGERSAIVALSGLVDGFAAGGVIMPLRDDIDAHAALLAMLPQPPSEDQAAA